MFECPTSATVSLWTQQQDMSWHMYLCTSEAYYQSDVFFFQNQLVNNWSRYTCLWHIKVANKRMIKRFLFAFIYFFQMGHNQLSWFYFVEPLHYSVIALKKLDQWQNLFTKISTLNPRRYYLCNNFTKILILFLVMFILMLDSKVMPIYRVTFFLAPPPNLTKSQANYEFLYLGNLGGAS